MNNQKNEIYMPNYSVCSILSSTLVEDHRLMNLWEKIGPKVTADMNYEACKTGELIKSINHMFSINPIAYTLMNKIEKYNSEAEQIRIIPIRKNSSGPNCTCICDLLTSHILKKPWLITHEQSNIYVVLSSNTENENIIDLYMWSRNI